MGNSLKEKAISGVIYLSIKRVLVQVILTLSSIFLARLLFPEDFGTFATIQFVITILMVLTDLGLGVSLIQKKGPITLKEVNSALLIQYVLSIFIVLVTWFAAPIISAYFDLGEKGIQLLRLTSLSIILLPIDSIGSAVLERSLQYNKLVISEVIELVLGLITTIFLALLGFGIYSLVYGNLVSRLGAAITSFYFAKMQFGFNFSLTSLKNLLKFGIPFQSNTFLSLLSGPIILLYLSKQVGVEDLGYFQFASGLIVLPLAFSEIVNRVIFPLGSRIQVNDKHLKIVIEKAIALVSVTTVPIMAFEIVSVPSLIHFIYTDKWVPAIPAIYIGLFQMLIVSYCGVFSQLLLAKGFVRTLRNIGFIWAMLTWILAPFLINNLGFIGMNLTNLLVSLTGLWYLKKLKEVIGFELLKYTIPFFAISGSSGFIVLILVYLLPKLFISFIFSLAVGAIFYIVLIFAFQRKTLFENYEIIRNSIFSKIG